MNELFVSAIAVVSGVVLTIAGGLTGFCIRKIFRLKKYNEYHVGNVAGLPITKYEYNLFYHGLVIGGIILGFFVGIIGSRMICDAIDPPPRIESVGDAEKFIGEKMTMLHGRSPDNVSMRSTSVMDGYNSYEGTATSSTGTWAVEVFSPRSRPRQTSWKVKPISADAIDEDN